VPFINVGISDELNERFKIYVIKKYGTKKGAIKEAVTEAIELLLKENEG